MQKHGDALGTCQSGLVSSAVKAHGEDAGQPESIYISTIQQKELEEWPRHMKRSLGPVLMRFEKAGSNRRDSAVAQRLFWHTCIAPSDPGQDGPALCCQIKLSVLMRGRVRFGGAF